ncbi:hypothetical protein ACQUQP_07230 [Marinobacterium sp. YM272]|uniref:hypothetical protein n=1 Tax=Marinobacterium sp. YM272 TaxID=3421654 RepID=UPI003D7F8764
MVRRKYALPLVIALLLGGCASQDKSQSLASIAGAFNFSGQPLTASMLACLASQERLSGAQRRQQMAASTSANPASAEQRFSQACLLGHAQASDAELAQAAQRLKVLLADPDFAEPEQQQLIAIYQRKLELMQALRNQVRETRAYRQKIEELKGLEEALEPASPSLGTTTPENGL